MPFYNLARVTTPTTGTGTITLGAAVQDFLTFAQAGALDGDSVTYGIHDPGVGSEVGQGTYHSAGPTLTRVLVHDSTNGGSLLSLSGNAQVFLTLEAASFNSTGTGNLVRASAPSISNPVLVAPALGTPISGVGTNLTGSAAGFTLIGTNTNHDAGAGLIGEYLSQNVPLGSPVTLTSNTSANIASLALTAGDWDVSANFIAGGGTGAVSSLEASINTVSATLGTAPNGGAYFFSDKALAAGALSGHSIGTRRLSLSASATAYLVARAIFAGGSCFGAGFIGARRAGTGSQ